MRHALKKAPQMANINNINSALTGSGWLKPNLAKPDFGPADFAARDVIDAPDWVPTGGHQLYECSGAGWKHQLIWAEQFRAGVVFA